jgi:stage III sporulation protein AA
MKAIEKVLYALPLRIRGEILRLVDSRGVGVGGISEIRLRTVGKNSVTVSGEKVPLASSVSPEDMSKTVSVLCGGSLYANRDGIREGYISLPGGVRVGVCGEARYDGGKLVGISNITSLVFRIPTDSFFGSGALYEAWLSCRHGMLIYSPPGVGKTTALRTLVGLIAGGRSGEEVCVVDERREFSHESYNRASVDILRGYKRAEGMEIALRTLSPGVIAVDEVGRLSEAEAMLESMNSGVKIIATAHSGSLDELRKRANMKPFFAAGIFDVFVGISLKLGRRELLIERAGDT